FGVKARGHGQAGFGAREVFSEDDDLAALDQRHERFVLSRQPGRYVDIEPAFGHFLKDQRRGPEVVSTSNPARPRIPATTALFTTAPCQGGTPIRITGSVDGEAAARAARKMKTNIRYFIAGSCSPLFETIL